MHTPDGNFAGSGILGNELGFAVGVQIAGRGRVRALASLGIISNDCEVRDPLVKVAPPIRCPFGQRNKGIYLN